MFRGRPIIGFTPLYDEKKESYWMLPGYMKAAEEQGGIALMLPLSDDRDELDYFIESCDGLVLTGGHDVSPWVYQEAQTEKCSVTCPERDRMDSYILRQAVAWDKAILGICRGHQLMNAVYGGTLYQDHPSEHPSEINHRMAAPYNRCAHMVQLVPDSPLQQLLQTDKCPVNSCHHQAIRDLAPNFAVMATAADGLIESIYMPGKKFVWGVQWHPEFWYQDSPHNQAIIGAFLEAAKK